VESGYQEPMENEDRMVVQIAALRKMWVKDKSTLYFLYNAVDESSFEKIANLHLKKKHVRF